MIKLLHREYIACPQAFSLIIKHQNMSAKQEFMWFDTGRNVNYVYKFRDQPETVVVRC